MAISYQNNGNGTSTVTFTYTASTQKVLDTLEDAGKYWQDIISSVAWASLTNQQKLNVVDDAVRKALIEWAKTEHAEQAIDAARATATSENETRYLP